MPLGGLGRMSWYLGPVTMIMPPSFVMHGRRVKGVKGSEDFLMNRPIFIKTAKTLITIIEK